MAVRSHMKCTSCGTQLSCGCQLRTASNGTKVCTGCITNYEQQLKQQREWNHVAVVTPVDQNPST
jgi:hypothetical protein